MRRAAVPVLAIGRIETGQVHLLDRVQHEPGEMAVRQPLPQRRRQQKLLLTINRDEVLGHAPNRPHQPGRNRGFVQRPRHKAATVAGPLDGSSGARSSIRASPINWRYLECRDESLRSPTPIPLAQR